MPGRFEDSSSESILGIAVPDLSAPMSNLPGPRMVDYNQATSSSIMANYSRRQQPATTSSQNLPYPAPTFAHSSGSSTRRSESPGSFSRTSTPTSMSSYSPGISVPAKSPLHTRQLSPTSSRPPVTRRYGVPPRREDMMAPGPRGLPALRESAASSSSSSTIKGVERAEGTRIGKPGNKFVAPPGSAPSRALPEKQAKASKIPAISGYPINSYTQRLVEAMSESETHGVPRPRQSTISPILRMGPPLTRTVPTRPSRENTPKLDNVTDPPQVIQSNLNRLITTGHKRRDSIEKPFQPEASTGTPLLSRPTLGRSPSNASSVKGKPSKLPSPSPGPAGNLKIHKDGYSQAKETPTGDSNVKAGRSIKEPSALSVGTAKSSSRFGLFTKRTKSPLEVSSIESMERAAKKGPAAGTGHEGYGKYARRGRSGSTSTIASRGRSTSTGHSGSMPRPSTSRKSSFASQDEPEMDNFLRDRLTPVIISGGGQISDNRNSEVYSSGASSAGSHRGLTLTHSPVRETNLISKPYDDSFFNRDAREPDHTQNYFDHVSDQSTDDTDFSRRAPTLAARRSLHRSQLFKEAEPLRLPTHINTRVLVSAAITESRDGTHMSSLPTDDSSLLLTDSITEGREGNWLKSRKTEKSAKSPRKWNFFQRAQAASKTSMTPSSYDGENNLKELPVAISRLPESRSVAHYAMLDADDQSDFGKGTYQPQASGNVEQVQMFGPDVPPVENDNKSRRQYHKLSMLLPSPPNSPAEFAHLRGDPPSRVDLHQLSAAAPGSIVVNALPKPREPRLQQVGRIPRVISKRDRLHNPAPQSFSRPFMRTRVVDNELSKLEHQRVDLKNAERPTLGVQTEMLAPTAWGEPDSSKPASAPVGSVGTRNPPGRAEFLKFLPRIDSEVSGSSSSGVLSLATTAIVPPPGTALSEDEVWNEYDDFLDNVDARASRSKDYISQQPMPRKSQWTPEPLHIRKESLVIGSTDSPSNIDLPQSPGGPPSYALPSPPKKPALLSSFPPADATLTPVSFSDFFAGYGDRNRSITASRRQSASSGSHYSSDLSPPGYDKTERRRNTDIMAEKTGTDPGPQSNLRFSALMTSRWLSFGRVLFSPAHVEIQSNRQDRVLVLDGLGNDDWSFYCALTYPGATVYNLSSFRRTSTGSERKRNIDGYGSPSNHRQIYHNNMKHPFPFPKGFFTAAVFRFPVASSEDAYFNAVSECKRVLRPGGYLEMSILDLDMVNMGNRARRAVRMLKVKMQTAEPEVSLKPVSDNIQKMLGRRGFENLSRCTVSVPVSGSLADSAAGSFDDRNMSLGDMLKDSSQQGDESITKMVSKVGRWWYTRCYEMSVLPADDIQRSIWTDKALLRECEKRDTGFKLLICYAQKPLAPRRRTVSV